MDIPGIVPRLLQQLEQHKPGLGSRINHELVLYTGTHAADKTQLKRTCASIFPSCVLMMLPWQSVDDCEYLCLSHGIPASSASINSHCCLSCALSVSHLCIDHASALRRLLVCLCFAPVYGHRELSYAPLALQMLMSRSTMNSTHASLKSLKLWQSVLKWTELLTAGAS